MVRHDVLTEPQCGTDLGLCKTRAEANADGSYNLFGTKIFISAGEHDLTSNIIHLVLARLPDAPAGIRGISLFVCPKFLPDAQGNPGARNKVACGSIEKKMGIKASSTCVINFDGAQAWLVGKPNKGMSAMFTMMNTARLAVGMQGLGIAEAAYQGAVTYARDRLQMRSLAGAKFPEKPADPIIVHPDVRRMLLKMRSLTEASRALSYWMGMELDIASHHPDPERRAAADDLVALLTPIVKAFLTDHGFDAANLGVQVFGGHGYIREWGMEQLVRDARITQIYEGTNGIQALDLVGRKLGTGVGRMARRFFHPVPSSSRLRARSRRCRSSSCRPAKGFRQAAAGDGVAGASRPRRSRGSRRRGDRLSPPLRADRIGLYVVPHGRDRAGEEGRRRARLLRSEARRRRLLHGPPAAGDQQPVHHVTAGKATLMACPRRRSSPLTWAVKTPSSQSTTRTRAQGQARRQPRPP
jgi:alkylation response protein AidB-like acyl-CoA dehydrogenase